MARRHGSIRTNALAALCLTGGLVGVGQSDDLRSDLSPDPAGPGALIRLPSQTSTLYESQTEVATRWVELWRPMCGSSRIGISSIDLESIARSHHQEIDGVSDLRRVDTLPNGIASNFNVVFLLAGSVPAEAVPAFAVVEQYLETQFTDSVTVTISVSYGSLSSGVLGATTPIYTTATYKDSRKGLKDGRDSNDTIQSYLPETTKINVRYSGTSSSITQEDRVYWTRANYKSTIGSASGDDASMTFSSTVTWDYDPSNGIASNSTSFVDVVIHEVGHAMGYLCGAGVWTKDMSSLDLFRFQYTDGSADYNPDSTSEFTSRPRLVAYNSPNDSHHLDYVSIEYRMSDGSPYQASHFREQSPTLGLMDPALPTGTTGYPNYFSTSDLDCLDSIGWDRAP